MNDIQQLIEEVRTSGASIRVEGENLKIKPADRISTELKAKLRQRKADVVRCLELVTRLSNLGVSIAIDKSTKAALPIFSKSDADALRHVADIYEPHKAPLNDEQCRVLHEDLNYYENVKQNQRNRGMSQNVG